MTNMINPPDITTYYIPEDQRSNNINLQNHIHEITKELCIPLWSLAKSYYEFTKKYINANTSEVHIRKIYDIINTISEDLIIMWWSTTRPFMIWSTNIREPSSDIDLYTKHTDILEPIARYAKDHKEKLLYSPHQLHYIFMEIKGNPISIAINDIYGIQPWLNDTIIVNDIPIITPELLISMKLKRKVNNTYREKDIYDIVNLLAAAYEWKYVFNWPKQEIISHIINSIPLYEIIGHINNIENTYHPNYERYRKYTIDMITNLFMK